MRVMFQYQVYKNDSNGYTVAKYKDISNNNKTVTCTGFNLPNVKVPYNFDVEEVEDKKYGKQYKVISFTEDISKTENDIIEYLASKLFNGIGKSMAKRIYDKFGDRTLDIIDQYPEELLNVKGISQNKLNKIVQSYKENHKYRDMMAFLSPFGFSAKNIVKLCDELGESYLTERIMENPYIICEVKGFSFESAERFKNKFGIKDRDPYRIKAAAVESIKCMFMSGCVSVTKEQLLGGMNKLLKLGGDDVYSVLWKNVKDMIDKQEIRYRKVQDKDKIRLYFYLPNIFEKEKALSGLVMRLIEDRPIPINIDTLMDGYSGITLDDSQRRAVSCALSNSLSIITGGAGMGKTTAIKAVSYVYGQIYPANEQIFLAPTGRAARRITQSTGKPAYTIHSYLNLVSLEDEIAYQSEMITINNALVVIDEFSMVDLLIVGKLLQAIKDNCTIVIVGDPEQLMSVGIGSVLNDFIKSGVIPVSALTVEHRQKEGSVLISNCNKIRSGMTDICAGSDFEIVSINDSRREEDMQALEDAMVEATVKEVAKYGIDEVVCLSPYKKYTAGVIRLNQRLQERLNPLKDNYLAMKGMNDVYFHPGDVVMHLSNDYTQGIMNGDVGRVLYIEKEDKEDYVMAVQYTDEAGKEKIIEYRKGDMENIQLAYACTVHKSQGSEYKSVVTCCCNFHYYAKKKNMLYTALTRAKEHVILFGNTDCIAETIENNVVDDRNTLLAYDLEHYTKPEEQWVEFPQNTKTVEDVFEQLCLPI